MMNVLLSPFPSYPPFSPCYSYRDYVDKIWKDHGMDVQVVVLQCQNPLQWGRLSKPLVSEYHRILELERTLNAS